METVQYTLNIKRIISRICKRRKLETALKMDLSRSDTYINVYIPRADGNDPRKLVPINSPMFGQDKIYKFSEQVKKDRKLFLGKKQLSLYEIYYRSKEGIVEKEATDKDDEEHKVHSDKEEENETQERHERDNEHENDQICATDTYAKESLPHVLGSIVNKVSLSLDSQTRYKEDEVRKVTKLKRFNEPLNSYVSNKKKATMMKRLDAEDYLDRQETVYDLINDPIQTVSETIKRPVTLNASSKRNQTIYGSRERQYSFYNSRQKTFYGTIYRSQPLTKPKKSFSAIETRTIQGLGLPPISLGSNKTQSTSLGENVPLARSISNLKALPVRQSSKPMNIYRQTSDVLLDGWTPKLSDANRRYLAVQMPQQRANVINLGQHSAF